MTHLLIFDGYAGKDSEIHTGKASGNEFITFSIASSETYKEGDEYKEYTIWLRVTAFGKGATSKAKRIKKGDFVSIKAKLNADKATGAPRMFELKDKSKATSYEATIFNFDDIQVITPVKRNGGNFETDRVPATTTETKSTSGDDEIPF